MNSRNQIGRRQLLFEKKGTSLAEALLRRRAREKRLHILHLFQLETPTSVSAPGCKKSNNRSSKRGRTEESILVQQWLSMVATARDRLAVFPQLFFLRDAVGRWVTRIYTLYGDSSYSCQKVIGNMRPWYEVRHFKISSRQPNRGNAMVRNFGWDELMPMQCHPVPSVIRRAPFGLIHKRTLRSLLAHLHLSHL